MIFREDKIINDTKLAIVNNQIIVNQTNSEPIYLFIENYQAPIEIVIKQGIQANIIEKCQANVPVNINITIEENASLKYLLMEISQDTKTKRNVVINRDADFKGICGFFNSGNTHSFFNVQMHEQGANAKIDSVAIGRVNNQENIDLTINHCAPYTTSEINNYGIADNESKIIYNVIGDIEKGMNAANVRQKTRGMMISPNAKITVNPTLLISEFDVQANHGATIGKISDEDLYYLMSRGISKNQAMELIIDGFLVPIIAMIDIPEYQEEFNCLAKGM